MKLIGENSLSTVLNKIFFIGFIGQILYLCYLIFGFLICYINLNTGNHFLSENFQTGDFEDEVRQTTPESLDFQFRMPFSDAVTTGEFTVQAFVSILFFLGFYSLFTFYLFKIFRGMSKDVIFNKNVILHLKQFSVLNLLFIPFYCIILFFIDRSFYNIDPVFILLHLSIGIVIIFIMEFFKKGYELQTQNDLTI